MNVRINKSFVKAILGARDMSLRDLAEKSQIGEATVYRVINGAAFSSETLGKLAKALDCHPVDLIEGEGYPDPHMDAPSVGIATA